VVAAPNKPENLHERAAQTPGDWRLLLSPKPSAAVHLYLTISPEVNHGVTVEKYSTRFGWNYEKHIQADGVATWYKLVKIRST
jgi:hypothetical protein